MKVTIHFTYKTKKGTEATMSTEEMSDEKAVLVAEDLQKTGRIKHIVFYDEQNTTWSFKEIVKYLKEVETEPHNITVYFDGGFDHNTKRSGLGCVIYYEQNGKSFRLRKNRVVEELDSNNEAEYAALSFSIEQLEF